MIEEIKQFGFAPSVAFLLVCAVIFGFVIELVRINERPPIFAQGATNTCRKNPQFISAKGFDPRVTGFTTTIERTQGLVMVNNVGRSFQDPSWQTGGHLGQLVFDEKASIFTHNLPVISVLFAEKSNIIYRVDSVSGEMNEFVKLPLSHDVTSMQPYAITGLWYDCDLQLIFATTLSGSALEKENGTLWTINTRTRETKKVLDTVDALSVATYNTQKGKELYIGLARSTRVIAYTVRSDGTLWNNKQVTAIDLTSSTISKVRKFTFSAKTELKLSLVEFDFNLIAPTEVSSNEVTMAFENGVWKKLQ